MGPYLAKVKELFSQSEHLHDVRPAGCLPGTIQSLEESLGAELPAAYVEFLQWAGFGIGEPFWHYRCAATDLPINAQSLREVAAENGLQDLIPADAVVFMGDEGHRYAWFRLPKEGDDPPVYFLNLDDDVTREDFYSNRSFSDFVLLEVATAVQALAEKRNRPTLPGDLVTVATYATEAEASLAMSLLENEGIRAFFGSEHVMVLFPWFTNLFGGLRLQVAEGDAERARRLLAERKG